jgi:ubiquinol-cytochrome c reductase iron-sulfur subunit
MSGDMTHEEHSAVAAHEHGHGVVAEGNPFADPGLPEHLPRLTDIDERAAKRSERIVAGLFTLSAVSMIAFMVCYTEVPNNTSSIVDFFPLGAMSASNFALGVTLGVALFAMGAGAIYWARTLMTDVEVPQERHHLASTAADKVEGIAEFQQGVKDSGWKERPLIRRTLIGAMAVLPLPAVWILRDLGPLPGTSQRQTAWTAGELIINDNSLSLDGTKGNGVRPEDLEVGTLISASPAAVLTAGDDTNDMMSMSAILLVRMNTADIKSQQEIDWGYDGIVAFSKICTHVGCPVQLYEQQTHSMLCPCHQSTFDLSDNGRVIFGPAARSLPQLPITVNADGFLVARSGFNQPVGPSFWERG